MRTTLTPYHSPRPDVSAKVTSIKRGVISVGAESSTLQKGPPPTLVKSFSIPSAEAMEQLGSSIGENAERGDTILLIGCVQIRLHYLVTIICTTYM